MRLENGQEKPDEWYNDAYFQNYPRHDRRIAQIIRRIPFKGDNSAAANTFFFLTVKARGEYIARLSR